MTVGYPWTKASVDARAGYLALTLRETLDGVQRLHTQLVGKSTQDLIDEGWDEDEAALLKSTFADLDRLARIAAGQETQPAASDFWWFARHIVGPN